MSRSQVEIRIVVKHDTDEEYEDIMDTIETAIRMADADVEEVTIGIGEDYQ